jgi:hypothetical protein
MTDAEKLAAISLRVDDLADKRFSDAIFELFSAVDPKDKKIVEEMWNRLWAIKSIIAES